MLGFQQPKEISTKPNEPKIKLQYKPPPPIKFGTPEDTLASCLSFMPKPPKKNLIRQLCNFPMKLRYLMVMDAVHPEDKDRQFILQYNLSTGTILIQELFKRNSGRREGCFLSETLVKKPGQEMNQNDPLYYTPEDFFIGAKINIFNHRFIIEDADLFVYKYIQANSDKFNSSIKQNMKDHFQNKEPNLISSSLEKEINWDDEVII